MNTINRFALTIVLLLTFTIVIAQSRSYHIYDQYAQREGFISLSFSKAMIDAVNLTIDEENKKVTGDLMEVRILLVNREKNKEIGSLYKLFSGKFEKLNYRKIDPSDSKGSENVEFWIEGNSKTVKECHVIVCNSDDKEFSCLVSFYGNFKVEDLKSFEKFSRKQAEKKDENE